MVLLNVFVPLKALSLKFKGGFERMLSFIDKDSPKFKALFSDIRSRYDDRIIIVDSAPVLEVDDVLTLIPNIDCMLIVVESGATTTDDLAKTIELLDGVPIIGTVLNKVDKKVVAAY